MQTANFSYPIPVRLLTWLKFRDVSFGVDR